MYLKKATHKSGRVYLPIAEGYYDPAKKQTRTVNVQKLGYLDVPAAEYADPLAHFQSVVEKMNAEKQAQRQSLGVTLDMTEPISRNMRKNIGYAALSVIYHELEIDRFFANRQRSIGAKYNLNMIMRLLVFSRFSSPGSKMKAFEERDWFFERGDFTLDDVYRGLSRIASLREALQVWIHEHVRARYGRDTSIAYYDVTNYYFEIDHQDELRRKGVSKEHRPNPIIQMGMLMDNSGLPIAYQLFPGNSNDCTTLLPILKKIRKEYGIGKAVIVSDKGLNTQKNAYYLANSRGGYIFSQSVRGGTKELKAFVLNETGYEKIGEDYKKKSRQFTREVEFQDGNGKVVKAKIAEKQVVFYSRDYDEKAKADRAPTIEKARALLQNPDNFNKYNTYGAAKYIQHIEFDKETGEVLRPHCVLTFNNDVLTEEEKLDGYYVLVTSRYYKTDEWVIDTYKGLWRIEETFRVTKSELETRPVFVSTEDHIQAHFLTCFVALGIDLNKKFRTRAEIKNIIAHTKSR